MNVSFVILVMYRAHSCSWFSNIFHVLCALFRDKKYESHICVAFSQEHEIIDGGKGNGYIKTFPLVQRVSHFK